MSSQIYAKGPGFVGEILFIGEFNAVEDRCGLTQICERDVYYEMEPDVEDSITGCIDCLGNYLIGEKWLKHEDLEPSELRFMYATCTLFGVPYCFEIRLHLELDKEHGQRIRYNFEPVAPTNKWEQD